jgi:hypothetical protein
MNLTSGDILRGKIVHTEWRKCPKAFGTFQVTICRMTGVERIRCEFMPVHWHLKILAK